MMEILIGSLIGCLVAGLIILFMLIPWTNRRERREDQKARIKMDKIPRPDYNAEYDKIIKKYTYAEIKGVPAIEGDWKAVGDEIRNVMGGHIRDLERGKIKK